MEAIKYSEETSEKYSEEITDVSMRPASNGIMVCYTEKKMPKRSKNSYDNCSYNYEQEVFEMQEGENKDDIFERALSRFKELWKKQNSY